MNKINIGLESLMNNPDLWNIAENADKLIEIIQNIKRSVNQENQNSEDNIQPLILDNDSDSHITDASIR